MGIWYYGMEKWAFLEKSFGILPLFDNYYLLSFYNFCLFTKTYREGNLIVPKIEILSLRQFFIMTSIECVNFV